MEWNTTDQGNQMVQMWDQLKGIWLPELVSIADQKEQLSQTRLS